jgi:hypothetical protein
MEKQHASGIIFPIFIVVVLTLLSGVVAKSIAYDDQLVQISLIGMFLLGFLTHWAIIKLGIY